MDVVISGSSGLIGSALTTALEAAGHRAISLVRRTARHDDEIAWKPSDGEIDAERLDGVDAVVHLAGAGIGDKRWNDAYKKLLVESRTTSTSLLASTLAKLDDPPRRLISGSAIGYYGERGDELLTEASGPGDDFLAGLVQEWEAAAQPAVDAGISTAFIRSGIVLADHGGVLAKMLPLFKVGLGGRLGSGRQYVSWITLADEVRAIIHLLESEISGPVNLTAPSPVSNAELTDVLGDVLRRPTVLPVPAVGPRLLLGREMADSLLFTSQRVIPSVLTESGFEHHHPTLEAGLRAVLDR